MGGRKREGGREGLILVCVVVCASVCADVCVSVCADICVLTLQQDVKQLFRGEVFSVDEEEGQDHVVVPHRVDQRSQIGSFTIYRNSRLT